VTPGERAYHDWRQFWEATCQDGSPMATWAQLTDEIRECWERSKSAWIYAREV